MYIDSTVGDGAGSKYWAGGIMLLPDSAYAALSNELRNDRMA